MKFYGRDEELKRLGKYWHDLESSGKLVVLYGRRRIGKTTLVKKAFEGMDEFFYFFVARKDGGLLLREFSETLSAFMSSKGQVTGEFTSWDSFFRALFSQAQRQRLVVVFDEFQNFHYVDPSVFSVLQNIWDDVKERKLLLVCLGSYTGLMKKLFREEKEPMYGRVDRFINLKPFQFRTVSEVLSDMGVRDMTDHIRFFSTLGGVPRYLEMVEDHPHATYKDFITSFIGEGEFVKEEGTRILAQEFARGYRSYFSALEAISMGKATLKEIADWVQEPPTNVSRYLRDLTKGYEIVQRTIPITDDPRKSKKGRYFIKDNFYRFWFRYVHRHLSHLEIGNYRHVIDEILRESDSFAGRVYEKVWMEKLLEMSADSRLPFTIELIGPWWDRAEEIDLVALESRSHQIMFCEVKWTGKMLGPEVVQRLKEKAEKVRWHDRKRKEHYVIISRKGFTPACSRVMEVEGVLGLTLKDLLR